MDEKVLRFISGYRNEGNKTATFCTCRNAEEFGLSLLHIVDQMKSINDYMYREIGESYQGDYVLKGVIDFIMTAVRAVKIRDYIHHNSKETELSTLARLADKSEESPEELTFEGRESYTHLKLLWGTLNNYFIGGKLKDDDLIIALHQAPIVRDILHNYVVTAHPRKEPLSGLVTRNYLDFYEVRPVFRKS